MIVVNESKIKKILEEDIKFTTFTLSMVVQKSKVEYRLKKDKDIFQKIVAELKTFFDKNHQKINDADKLILQKL